MWLVVVYEDRDEKGNLRAYMLNALPVGLDEL